MTKLIESGYDLKEFKRDLFDVLVRSIPEIPMLIKSLKEGTVDGTTYEKNSSTNCVCLQGTLEHSERYKSIYGTEQRDSERPIERYFYAIREGDTPEKSLVTKTVLFWIDEFVSTIAPFLRDEIKIN